MKAKRGNNNGRGWYYEFADGTHGWVLGLSANELKIKERDHGKLISWKAA